MIPQKNPSDRSVGCPKPARSVPGWPADFALGALHDIADHELRIALEPRHLMEHVIVIVCPVTRTELGQPQRGSSPILHPKAARAASSCGCPCIGEMPSSPDPRSPIFFKILCYSPPPAIFPIPDHPFFSKSFASVSRSCPRSCPSRPTEYRRDAAAQPQRVGFAEESTGRKNPLGLLLSSS